MPVVKVTRAGVRSAPREVPTDTTAAILPLTADRVGREAPEDEQPTRVGSLAEAFEKFAPRIDFRRIDMLHRMRERFSVLSVKRAWDNEEQRREIIGAVAEFEEQLRRIAGGEG